tara:strand:+ start:301 stop:615 length:315 start_codon:yes stop_codon:yes gene_type:complete
MATTKKDERKIKAIQRKNKKIASMKKQSKTPSRTSGSRGVKDYNPSANKKRIARKTKAVARKTSKLSSSGKRKLKDLSGDGKITRKDVLIGRGVIKKGSIKKRK